MKKDKYYFYYLAVLLMLSLATYFLNFKNPSGLFWDENYHMASAQKYIDHVMFMEPHPPLGKQFIALGEWMFQANSKLTTTSFLNTDYINSVPDGYSFFGVRFFPSLFAALSAILFFMILYTLIPQIQYAFLFSSLYIFDNAMIVHSRGAMLEGTQLFFVLGSVLLFAMLLKKAGRKKLLDYFLLGILIGLAVAVKLNSAILCALFVFLAFEDFWDEVKKIDWKKFKINFDLTREFIWKTLLAVGGILVPLLLSFYIHFATGEKVLDNRFYNASAEYKQIITLHETANPFNMPVMLRDYLGYIHNYEKGVPKWDPTKEGENGSPAFGWPFGYKSINYRWSKWNGTVAYLYLQGNPLIWWTGLFGILLAFAYIIGRIFFKTPIADPKKFKLLVYFTLMYAFYMGVMLSIERVMYLYHYFIPLLFSFIIFYLIFALFFEEKMVQKDRFLLIVTALFAMEIVGAYFIYFPFSYFMPLDNLEFMRRVWSKFWGLVPITF